ncbi:MAG TPA: sigma factor-like helix-turn-helix DNA-binding protein [Nocardioidaceae bacterium]|nr:sigma factor-like helix-turn-helix DNA-binding protein [Nocardioidaceae bacterium]
MGDEFVEFVNARASALLRTAILLMAGDRAAAEELVQTAMAQAYAKRRRIRTPAATETEARRSLVRAATRGRRDGGRSGTGDVGQDLNRLTILDALRALPARQRATVVLRYHDDYSEAQVGSALGSSAGTVRRYGTRALELLCQRWPEEEQLRASLAAAVDPVHADPDLIARVLEQSRSARRQRRRSLWLSGCAAALVTVVGASLVYFGGSDDSSPGPDRPRLLVTDPIAWARRLPQGPPVRLAYIVDADIHLPGLRAPLPRGVGMPIGKTPEGWLVTVYSATRPGNGGQADGLRYGIVTANGSIELLPRDPYHGSVGLRALSPDGELFAMGGAVVDVERRRVIGRTPADAFYSTGWTPAGLLYASRRNASSWLWQPGSRPVAVPARLLDTAATAPVGLAESKDNCFDVVHLAADGGVAPSYDGCASGASSPVSLSPDGSHALTADMSVLDLDDETVTSFELPASSIAGFGWEDNNHFVLPVESRETLNRDRAVFVRCSIVTHECERAGPEFTKSARVEILVIPPR